MRRVLLLSFLALLGGGVAMAWWVYRDAQRELDTPLALPESPFRLDVPSGTGLRTLARDLADAGIIDNPWYLVAYARHAGLAHRIQAGEYQLTADMTPRSLLEHLVRGDVIRYSLTLVEGWTFRQVLAAITASPALKLEWVHRGPEEIMAALGEPGLHPEGLFFPDTYHYTRGTTDIELLKRARRRMDEVLDRLWAARQPGLPFEDPYRALVMASIIEKETGAAHERRTIAGVFARRLELGMRLQTDPTVIYGLGERFDGNLRRADLRTDHPYNTYTRNGLPPTPIGMPGAASIEAALDPAPGKELYFVSKGDGTHHFSATLEEHNRAVARYQLGRTN